MPERARQPLPDRAGSGIEDLARLVRALGPVRVRAFVAHWSAAEVALVERVIADQYAVGWRATPAAWRHHLDPAYNRWAYVELLSDRFAGAVKRTMNPHQQVNMPSQVGKTAGLMTGIGWALDEDPTKSWLYVTASDTKAKEEGGNLRDFLNEHSADLRVSLRPDASARGLWRTEQGGGLYCFGIDSTIVGYPATGGLVLDDLLRGYAQAMSQAERDRVWNTIIGVLRKRLASEFVPYIWAGTRWHEDDHFARQRAQAKADPRAYQFDIIRLAAIAEPPDPDNPDPVLRAPDPLGRAPGEVIEPERFSAAEVLARQADSSIGEWQASEQQRPAPPAGDLIKREWWAWDGENRPTTFDLTAFSWDMKGKDNDRGDFTVGQVWGRAGQHFWFLDQLRGQWPRAYAAVAMALLQVRWPTVHRHYVENAGYAPELKKELETARPDYVLDDAVASTVGVTATERAAVEETLRAGISGIELVNAVGPKVLRAENQTPKLIAGAVHLPALGPGSAGARALVDEAASFPRGPHDDTVDAWSQAMSKMSALRPGSVASPRGRRRMAGRIG